MELAQMCEANNTTEQNFSYFCKTVRTKSQENHESFVLLYSNQKFSTCVSLLRIQLDCYIRLMYLKQQSEEIRNDLLEDFYRGTKWKVRDSKMLEEISSYGWEKNVYQLGCAFIHLSRLNNIGEESVLNYLNVEDRSNIIYFINNYHNATLTTQSSNQELLKYLPNVMKKITDNLIYELTAFEN